jgi:serine/threonine protein kinase
MTNAFARGARIGDYIIEDLLVARAPEVAFRARHGILPRVVRVATLDPACTGERAGAIRLLREACVLEALHHPGVPRVYECGVIRRTPWIAVELVRGNVLDTRQRLPVREALVTVRDAAAILAHAHERSIVHRNLTPDRIVRARQGGTFIVAWGDAAVGLDDGAVPVTSGRPRFYRAPELASGECEGSADVFALGAVIYEAITGTLPLLQPTRLPDVPHAVHALLSRMLAPVAAERPSATQVRAEAARLAELHADGEPVIEEVEVELVDVGSVTVRQSVLDQLL